MSQSIDRVANSLFPEAGHGTANVKFFLGGATRVTAAQLADQLERASAQVRSGVATLVTDVDNYRAA